MINLRVFLDEYKKIILELIERTKKGEELSVLIKNRNNMLKKIEESDYDEEELKKIVKELSILKLENELQLTIKKEMVTIRKKINNIKTTRVIRERYNSTEKPNFILFRGKA
jgi:hypothetical protein